MVELFVNSLARSLRLKVVAAIFEMFCRFESIIFEIASHCFVMFSLFDARFNA